MKVYDNEEYDDDDDDIYIMPVCLYLCVSQKSDPAVLKAFCRFSSFQTLLDAKLVERWSDCLFADHKSDYS